MILPGADASQQEMLEWAVAYLDSGTLAPSEVLLVLTILRVVELGKSTRSATPLVDRLLRELHSAARGSRRDVQRALLSKVHAPLLAG